MFFTRSPLPVPSLLRIPTSYSQTKNKTTQSGGFIFWRRRRDYLGTQAFRCTVGVTASHCAKGILLVFCDACHSLALPHPRTASGRARPSRTSVALTNSNITFRAKIKSRHKVCFLFLAEKERFEVQAIWKNRSFLSYLYYFKLFLIVFCPICLLFLQLLGMR